MAERGGKREGAGRPVAEATLRAQIARDYISAELEKSLAPIVAKAINDSILGDAKARDWLSDRGWGKAVEVIVTEDEDGVRQPITGMRVIKDGA